MNCILGVCCWNLCANGYSWWRHQMETFSALLVVCAGNSPVPSEIPAQRLVTRSFDVFFDPRLNKWVSKQSWGWWFETLPCHYDVTVMSMFIASLCFDFAEYMMLKNLISKKAIIHKYLWEVETSFSYFMYMYVRGRGAMIVWDQDKMATILQTTFWYAFSWTKTVFL